MTDIVDRLLNPAVLITMIASGLAYSRLLWALNLRPTATLVIVAVVPGTIYLMTVWAIRGLQGTVTTVYIVMLIDWLIFANTGVLAVLLARRRRR